MSNLTANALLVAPSAAGATQVQNGTIGVYGSWVQFIASTAAPTTIAGVVIFAVDTTSNMDLVIDIGLGAASSEASIGTFRVQQDTWAGGQYVAWQQYMFLVPLGGIAAGQRVSLRTKSLNNSSVRGKYALLYYNSFDGQSADYATNPLSCYPVHTSSNVTITPSGTGWANSSWVELVSATASKVSLLGITHRCLSDSTDIEFDLGTGGAGSESVITTLRTVKRTAGPMQYVNLPGPYIVNSGVRLAIRIRKTGTDTTAFLAGLNYYSGAIGGGGGNPGGKGQGGNKKPGGGGVNVLTTGGTQFLTIGNAGISSEAN